MDREEDHSQAGRAVDHQSHQEEVKDGHMDLEDPEDLEVQEVLVMDHPYTDHLGQEKDLLVVGRSHRDLEADVDHQSHKNLENQSA